MVGSSCSWQFSFRREGQKRLGIKALHRELEQVDGRYTLRESGEANRGQFDSKNVALTPENTRSWESCGNLAWSDPEHPRGLNFCRGFRIHANQNDRSLVYALVLLNALSESSIS
jgi:hypothetical protein